uniref:Uncharacterized protein n=1 Tax=Alexandrium catenella TaxID=2925 RepID=A0A7S1SBZ3_ALECA
MALQCVRPDAPLTNNEGGDHLDVCKPDVPLTNNEGGDEFEDEDEDSDEPGWPQNRQGAFLPATSLIPKREPWHEDPAAPRCSQEAPPLPP